MKIIKTWTMIMLMVIALPLLIRCGDDSDKSRSTPINEELLYGTWVLRDMSYIDEDGNRKLVRINYRADKESWVLNFKKNYIGFSKEPDMEDITGFENPVSIIWQINYNVLHISNWFSDTDYIIKELTENTLILKYQQCPTLTPEGEDNGFTVDENDSYFKYDFNFVKNDSYKF